MRKIFISLVAILATGAGGAYLYPSPSILSAIKVRTALSTTQIGPPRDIALQQGPAAASSAPTERLPNIIVIMADDLGYDDISTFGGGAADGRLQTPHIDALAAQGAVFTQSYSGASTCAPSRAMLMTGRYTSRTGFAYTLMPPSMGRAVSIVAAGVDRTLPDALFDAEAAATRPSIDLQGLPPEEITLAESLKARGYHTVHIGKWHLGRDEA